MDTIHVERTLLGSWIWKAGLKTYTNNSSNWFFLHLLQSFTLMVIIKSLFIMKIGNYSSGPIAIWCSLTSRKRLKLSRMEPWPDLSIATQLACTTRACFFAFFFTHSSTFFGLKCATDIFNVLCPQREFTTCTISLYCQLVRIENSHNTEGRFLWLLLDAYSLVVSH